MGSLSAAKGFLEGWGASSLATRSRVEYRNIGQGGNRILTAGPLSGQAIWTGRIASRLAEFAPGPLGTVARMVSTALSPLISIPTCWVAAAVKGGFYESSVGAKAKGQTKYYELGGGVQKPIQGTVSLVLEDGIARHFTLGRDITSYVKWSIEIEEKGEKKYFYYTKLTPAYEKKPEDKIKEVEIDGKKVRVRLEWEITNVVQNAVKVAVNGKVCYFKLGHEVPEPILGTVEVWEGWELKYYQLGKEISAPKEGCVEITARDQTLHYELGAEVHNPTKKTRTFVIDGKKRHFLSAEKVPEPTSGLAEWVNKIPKLPLKLPMHLGIRTVKVMNFISEKLSDILRIITIVAGVALAYLGHTFMAAGILLAVTYEWLDHDLGIIPRKISLFIERWMPFISLVGLLIVGSTLSKIFAAINLLMYIPSTKRYLANKIDRFYRTHLLDKLINSLVDYASRKARARGEKGASDRDRRELKEAFERVPLLEECEAPLKDIQSLSYLSIMAILEGDKKDYEINPPHCTKLVESLYKWPEDRDFTFLLKLWNDGSKKWLTAPYYSRLLNNLVDDQRFTEEYLNPMKDSKGEKRFPPVKRFMYERNWEKSPEENAKLCAELQKAHREQIEGYIDILAKEKNQTKNQFIVQWAKEQLEAYVGKLQSKRPIEGSQGDLEAAIQNTAKIISFLKKPETTEVAREDALFKLAVEGGNYCALGMHRAARETLLGFTEPFEMQMDAPLNGRLIRLGMQMARKHLIDRFFNGAVELLRRKKAFQDTAADVHLYERISLMLKRGFYPLTESEDREFALSDLVNLETFGLFTRVNLYDKYEQDLDKYFRLISINQTTKKDRLLPYLRSWVEQNKALSSEEKKILLNGVLSGSEENQANYDLYPKLYRLAFVISGIMREKKKAA